MPCSRALVLSALQGGKDELLVRATIFVIMIITLNPSVS